MNDSGPAGIEVGPIFGPNYTVKCIFTISECALET